MAILCGGYQAERPVLNLTVHCPIVKTYKSDNDLSVYFKGVVYENVN
jgi:hypothetical protein